MLFRKILLFLVENMTEVENLILLKGKSLEVATDLIISWL